jgi:hypothetical protein
VIVVLVNLHPTDKLEVVILPSIPLRALILGSVRFFFFASFRSRAALELEIVVLGNSICALSDKASEFASF